MWMLIDVPSWLGPCVVRMKSLATVSEELAARGIMPKGVPSLDRFSEAFERFSFQLPVRPDSIILIAGTNGKGSVLKVLESLFLANGERVGSYTSPHLVSITERITIQGKPISNEDFIWAYDWACEKTSDLGLSHFEMLTLMAAICFFSEDREPLDRVLFEVGLGGTWDATNAIPHGVSVITKVGYDHMRLLGSTLDSILQNKLGIVQDGNLVITGPLPHECSALIDQKKNEFDVDWREAKIFSSEVREGPTFFLKHPTGTVELNLAGDRGVENASIALAVVEALGLPVQKLLPALSSVQWMGRMSRFAVEGAPCPVYLSGDHNEQGLDSMLQLLPNYPYDHLHFLVGLGAEKQCDQMLGKLSRVQSSSLYITESPYHGLRYSDYGDWLGKCEYADADFRKVFQHVCDIAKPRDMIVVTGSLYLVGDWIKWQKVLKNSCSPS